MEAKKLVENLKTDLEWAEANEWESPIGLADDLRECIRLNAGLVHRCETCLYYHHAHVLTPDGKEKSYDEIPEDAFDSLFGLGVTAEYGVNVGGQCEVDENTGYSESKAVFRRLDDFCSRWRSNGEAER